MKAGVVVPVYGLPEESVKKNDDAETDERPVPPFATASTPTSDEVEILVKPDPLPVKILVPMLMLPKPEAIEPEVRIPTEERLVAVVRPFSTAIDEVARDETRPLVEKRRPFNDEARVVEPEMFNVPVAVRLVAVALPVMKVSPTTVRAEPGVVVPMPTLPLDKMENISVVVAPVNVATGPVPVWVTFKKALLEDVLLVISFRKN